MHERQIEEAPLGVREAQVEATGDGIAGDDASEWVGREGFRLAAEHVLRGNWSSARSSASAGERALSYAMSLRAAAAS